ncbi:MAG: trigger factor [Chloroflexota bacterium]
MKVNTQPLEDHQVKLIVEIEQEKMTGALRRVARDLAGRMKIPGFRPGKAPYEVVERMVGAAELRKEATHALVDEIYSDAIKEAGIEPYEAGELEDIQDDQSSPLILNFKVPLKAEVELGDYASLLVPYEPPIVNDEEIEKVLEDMRQDEAIVEQVERDAQEGDILQVQINGNRLDRPDETEAILIKERNAPVVIESGEQDINEWPFFGFSRQLVGMKAGDEKKIEYTYPDDSPFESLRGVPAVFDIKIERVSLRTLPVLDDEFARSSSESADTLEGLKASIRSKLEQEKLDKYKTEYDDKIIEKLIEIATFKYPSKMVEDETAAMSKRLESRLEQSGFNLETFLKIRNQEMETYRADIRKSAEESVRRMLVITEIAVREKIEIDSDEVMKDAKETVDYIIKNTPREDLKKVASDRLTQNVIESLVMEKVTDKVWLRIRAIAKGEAGIVEDEIIANETAIMEVVEPSADN